MLFLCEVTVLIWLYIDFARTDYSGPALTNLVDIIDYVKPTALLGLSTIQVPFFFFSLRNYITGSLTVCFQGAFNKSVVEKMTEINKRPIIFPLSNPINLCEVTFQDALEW